MNAFRLALYSSTVITALAGTPFTTVPLRTSFVTTLPAATTEFSPIVTFGRMTAHPPIIALFFTTGGVKHLLIGNLSLSRQLFGAIKALLPILQPLLIVTRACILQFLPIMTSLPMSQKLQMRVPSPIFVLSPMTT